MNQIFLSFLLRIDNFSIDLMQRISYFCIADTAQKMKFPLRISSVNLTKSAVLCGFGHIY